MCGIYARARFCSPLISPGRPQGGAKAVHLSPQAERGWPAWLLLQLAFENLDFLGQGHVVADQALDLAHRMQHGGVVAAAEAPADFRQRPQGKVLARYI